MKYHFKSWLIDYDLCAFGLDTLHDTLDCRLAEVVRVRLHSQAVHTDNTFMLFSGIPYSIFIVIASLAKYGIGI